MNAIVLFILLCALGRCATGSISNVWIGSKKSEGKMFTGLLILSIVGFIYLMYVLVKPEKF